MGPDSLMHQMQGMRPDQDVARRACGVPHGEEVGHPVKAVVQARKKAPTRRASSIS